jgi:hypothetical protein
MKQRRQQGQHAEGTPLMTPDSAALSITQEWDAGLASADPLAFPGYSPPDAGGESVRTGTAVVAGHRVAVIQCRFDACGGTMGAVAGERIVRAFVRATGQRLPVVEYVASGGARRLRREARATAAALRDAAVAARLPARRSRSISVTTAPRDLTTPAQATHDASIDSFKILDLSNDLAGRDALLESYLGSTSMAPD